MDVGKRCRVHVGGRGWTQPHVLQNLRPALRLAHRQPRCQIPYWRRAFKSPYRSNPFWCSLHGASWRRLLRPAAGPPTLGVAFSLSLSLSPSLLVRWLLAHGCIAITGNNQGLESMWRWDRMAITESAKNIRYAVKEGGGWAKKLDSGHRGRGGQRGQGGAALLTLGPTLQASC